MKSRGKKQSLKRKILLVLSGIFICFLVIYISQYVYVDVLHKNYERIDTLTNHYNCILTYTEDLKNLMNDYSYGYGTKEQIDTNIHELTGHAEAFRDILNEEEYERISIDLNNLVESYAEWGEARIKSFDEKRYADTIEANEKFNEIKSFIISKFADADRPLRVYSDNIFREISVYQKTFQSVLLTISILIILMFLLLVYFLWQQFLKPVSELSYASSEYHLGKKFDTLCKNIDFTREDEMGILSSNVLRMVHKLEESVELEHQISNLKIKALKTEKLANEAQLKLMQSRINPHFLFNAFNMIGETAYLEDAEQTYELLEALGAFLRYNLDNLDKIVKFNKEIDNLSDYILIQKKRFGDRIDFRVNYDRSADNLEIPCLILQPLVENAIIHGVGRYKQGGKIWIDVNMYESYMELCIGDNGLGMNEQELSRVRRLIETAEEQTVPSDIEDTGGHSCIGIRNVFGRLKLYYGAGLQVAVESMENERTEFRIKIPVKEAKAYV